jgi:tetratricopeptide (TPR) repeat protein
MALSDRGHYTAALELFNKSVARAERCGRPRQAAWSLALIGRVHLLRGDLKLAMPALEESLALISAERWSAFRPFPEVLRGEVWLLCGDRGRAAEDLDHAFRLACRLGDPCWEALTCRLAGLLAAERSDLAAARSHFADALARATRVSDPYTWVHAHILDSTATLAVATHDGEAAATVDRLAALAERCGLRELIVRAHLHRAHLGDHTSMKTARVLAAEIDNPALSALLDAPVPA